MPALASINDIYRVKASTQDIVKEALELLGVIAEGEPLEAAQLQNSLRTFNFMVDNWNTEKLTIYVLARNTFTLTASTNPHEIGPGIAAPGLDAPRQNRLEQGQAWISGGSLGQTEDELEIYTRTEWADRYDGAAGASLPSALYYEPLFPTAKLWFDVKPDQAYTLVLYLEQMLQQILSDGTTTELKLPPGYAEALASNLAIKLAPKYGRSAPVEVINSAVESKANIKRLNRKPIYFAGDPAIIGGGQFNIFRGDY